MSGNDREHKSQRTDRREKKDPKDKRERSPVSPSPPTDPPFVAALLSAIDSSSSESKRHVTTEIRASEQRTEPFGLLARVYQKRY